MCVFLAGLAFLKCTDYSQEPGRALDAVGAPGHGSAAAFACPEPPAPRWLPPALGLSLGCPQRRTPTPCDSSWAALRVIVAGAVGSWGVRAQGHTGGDTLAPAPRLRQDTGELWLGWQHSRDAQNSL